MKYDRIDVVAWTDNEGKAQEYRVLGVDLGDKTVVIKRCKSLKEAEILKNKLDHELGL